MIMVVFLLNATGILLKFEILNLKRTHQELEKVLEYTSFEFMKQLEQKDDWKRMKRDVNFNQGSFIRKGSLNSFKEEVQEELLNKFIENSKNNFYNFNN